MKNVRPRDFVNWNEDTFKKLVDSVPEQLTPRMRITHSMVLAEVEQGGNARARVDQLIDDSLQPDEEKVKLHVRAAEVLQTLIDAGVVVHDVDENGQDASPSPWICRKIRARPAAVAVFVGGAGAA
ncbi:MAG: DUF3516 domain-containing protein [Senegalimassilia faecalis]